MNAITREFFARTANTVEGQLASDMKAMTETTPDPEAIRRLAQMPYLNALLRTTSRRHRGAGGPRRERPLPQAARAVS